MLNFLTSAFGTLLPFKSLRMGRLLLQLLINLVIVVRIQFGLTYLVTLILHKVGIVRKLTNFTKIALICVECLRTRDGKFLGF